MTLNPEMQRIMERLQQIEVALTAHREAINIKGEERDLRMDRLSKAIEGLSDAGAKGARLYGEVNESVEETAKGLNLLSSKWSSLQDSCNAMCNVMDKMIDKLAQMTGSKGEVGQEIAEAMSKDMESIYDDKLRELFGAVIDLDPLVGDSVICDLCGIDWTDTDTTGGFMLAGQAVCPQCAPGIEERAIEEAEDDLIKDRCPTNMSFASWVLNIVRRDFSKPPKHCQEGDDNFPSIKTISEWRKDGENE